MEYTSANVYLCEIRIVKVRRVHYERTTSAKKNRKITLPLKSAARFLSRDFYHVKYVCPILSIIHREVNEPTKRTVKRIVSGDFR